MRTDPPLLQAARAALASGWPTLHLLRSDEAAAERALADLESVLGPLPQAELLVPWDGEPFELRVDLPGLSPDRWDALCRVCPDATLRPGLRPGARLAEDEGAGAGDYAGLVPRWEGPTEAPAEDRVGWGLTPDDLSGLLADPSQCEELEVHVVPDAPGRHDTVVEQVVARLEADGAPWSGGPPRWLRTPDGWAFTPTWRVLRASVDTRVADVARALLELEGVAAVRVVPGEPAGLGESWRWAEPAWTWGGRRCFLRVRDGVDPRDRLPTAQERPARARDAELDAVLGARLTLPRPARPIVDPTGREGLGLLLDASTSEASLDEALRALGDVDAPDLAPVVHVSRRGGGTLVRLWYRADALDGPPWD